MILGTTMGMIYINIRDTITNTKNNAKQIISFVLLDTYIQERDRLFY